MEANVSLPVLLMASSRGGREFFKFIKIRLAFFKDPMIRTNNIMISYNHII